LQELNLYQNPCAAKRSRRSSSAEQEARLYLFQILQTNSRLYKYGGDSVLRLLDDDDDDGRQLQYLADWNRSGARRLLVTTTIPIPTGLWPRVLGRANRLVPGGRRRQASVLFSLLQESQVVLMTTHSSVR
jgi:hypothetical protein